MSYRRLGKGHGGAPQGLSGTSSASDGHGKPGSSSSASNSSSSGIRGKGTPSVASKDSPSVPPSSSTDAEASGSDPGASAAPSSKGSFSPTRILLLLRTLLQGGGLLPILNWDPNGDSRCTAFEALFGCEDSGPSTSLSSSEGAAPGLGLWFEFSLLVHLVVYLGVHYVGIHGSDLQHVDYFHVLFLCLLLARRMVLFFLLRRLHSWPRWSSGPLTNAEISVSSSASSAQSSSSSTLDLPPARSGSKRGTQDTPGALVGPGCTTAQGSSTPNMPNGSLHESRSDENLSSRPAGIGSSESKSAMMQNGIPGVGGVAPSPGQPSSPRHSPRNPSSPKKPAKGGGFHQSSGVPGANHQAAKGASSSQQGQAQNNGVLGVSHQHQQQVPEQHSMEEGVTSSRGLVCTPQEHPAAGPWWFRQPLWAALVPALVAFAYVSALFVLGGIILRRSPLHTQTLLLLPLGMYVAALVCLTRVLSKPMSPPVLIRPAFTPKSDPPSIPSSAPTAASTHSQAPHTPLTQAPQPHTNVPSPSPTPAPHTRQKGSPKHAKVAPSTAGAPPVRPPATTVHKAEPQVFVVPWARALEQWSWALACFLLLEAVAGAYLVGVIPPLYSLGPGEEAMSGVPFSFGIFACTAVSTFLLLLAKEGLVGRRLMVQRVALQLGCWHCVKVPSLKLTRGVALWDIDSLPYGEGAITRHNGFLYVSLSRSNLAVPGALCPQFLYLLNFRPLTVGNWILAGQLCLSVLLIFAVLYTWRWELYAVMGLLSLYALYTCVRLRHRRALVIASSLDSKESTFGWTPVKVH